MQEPVPVSVRSIASAVAFLLVLTVTVGLVAGLVAKSAGQSGKSGQDQFLPARTEPIGSTIVHQAKSVVWELRQVGIYTKQYVPVCPDCKNEVRYYSTKCKCGTAYDWKSFTCPNCAGNGSVKCNQCSGKGKFNCWACKDRGRFSGDTCYKCKGSGRYVDDGRNDCEFCNAGRDSCSFCSGMGKLG